MRPLDLNHLVDLDALLTEGSVTGAAKRLHVSAPAMSRRLSSLRDALGDPLFVLAGRRLVPTTRALVLRDRVRVVIEDVRSILAPAVVDIASVKRSLTLRANDAFFGAWASRLVARVAAEAPGITLKFRSRAERGRDVLRSGEVDLDLGALGKPAPEIKSQAVLNARFVGVARAGHSLLDRPVDAARFVQWPHVVVSAREHVPDSIAEALANAGVHRRVVAEMPGYLAAFAVVMTSDSIAVVPEPFAQWNAEHAAFDVFELPIATPTIDIAMSWHPRNHADPVNEWLRAHVRAVMTEQRATGRDAHAH
jgi:DNA-binding transcriptional LysR family regulator